MYSLLNIYTIIWVNYACIGREHRDKGGGQGAFFEKCHYDDLITAVDLFKSLWAMTPPMSTRVVMTASSLLLMIPTALKLFLLLQLFFYLIFFFSCDKFSGIFGSQYWLIISDHFWSYISKLNNEKNGCVRRPFSFVGIFSRLLHDVYEKWNIIWTKKKLLQKCGFKFFFNYLNPLSLDPVEFRIYTSSIDESE